MVSYHMTFTTITVFLIFLAFGLGMASVSTQALGTSFGGSNSNQHNKVVLVVAHSFSFGHLTRKIHIPLGIITASCWIIQVWEGVHNEW